VSVLLSVLIRVVTAVVGIAVLLATLRRPPRVDVELEGDALVVRFGGWDVLWTLRRAVSVPRAQVERVAAADVADVPAPERWFRVGTAVPGVARAGSFGRGDRRDLWDVRTGSRVLVVELRPGAAYRRIVLQVPDPEGPAARLRDLPAGG
jgi:hypothetical protein